MRASVLLPPVLAIGLTFGSWAPGQTQPARPASSSPSVVTGTLESHLKLGRVLLDQRDLEGAIKEYRQAVSIAPESAEASGQLGLLLRETGKVQESIYYLRCW